MRRLSPVACASITLALGGGGTSTSLARALLAVAWCVRCGPSEASLQATSLYLRRMLCCALW